MQRLPTPPSTQLTSRLLSGASSVFNIDGTETTGTATGNTTAGGIRLFGGTVSTNYRTGEFGFIDNVALTGTQRTNLCHNQHLYWSTATSC